MKRFSGTVFTVTGTDWRDIAEALNEDPKLVRTVMNTVRLSPNQRHRTAEWAAFKRSNQESLQAMAPALAALRAPPLTFGESWLVRDATHPRQPTNPKAVHSWIDLPSALDDDDTKDQGKHLLDEILRVVGR